LLKKPIIQDAIQKEIDKMNNDNIASKQIILREMHEIREKALEKDKLQTSLNASVEKAKLAGHYKDPVDDSRGFLAFMQKITINVDEKKEKQETIDVTPKTEDTD
jgi:hypothetical protein